MIKRGIIFLGFSGLIVLSVGLRAQDLLPVKQGIPTTFTLKRVEAKNVCMGMANNRLFKKELLPVVIDDKTYYGCCEGCVNQLSVDEESRMAIDPVSRKVVDKATAVIGALPDGKVYYFENEENMNNFKVALRLEL